MILGFIGTGRISSSVIEGIFKSNLKIKKIYISPRNKLISKKLSKRFKKVTVSINNQQLIDKSNWIFLSITPQVGNKILSKLKFSNNKKIMYSKVKPYSRSSVRTNVLYLYCTRTPTFETIYSTVALLQWQHCV